MKIDILVVGNDDFIDGFWKSLEDNKSYINKIIIAGRADKKKQGSLDVEFLDLKTRNKALIRNELLNKAITDFVLFINSSSKLEEDTIEEMLSALDENPESDVIYANEVIVWNQEETVRNFDDYYGREIELLQTLAIEDKLPEFGVLVRKETVEKLGGFNEEYEDYEFYEFIYRNIKNLKLKSAEFSFCENYFLDSFIDTSYRSKCLRDVLQKYNWEKEIFYRLGWGKNRDVALSTAHTIVGDRLFFYYDLLNASEFYRRGFLSFENNITLGKLFDTYLLMGMFDKAEEVLYLGFEEAEKETRVKRLQDVKKIVKTLEEEVERGNLKDVLQIIPQVTEFYKGAPINNILGVVSFIYRDSESAYRFFYKAVTMNPLEKDYLLNLTDVAKQLGREEEVMGLIDRLVR